MKLIIIIVMSWLSFSVNAEDMIDESGKGIEAYFLPVKEIGQKNRCKKIRILVTKSKLGNQLSSVQLVCNRDSKLSGEFYSVLQPNEFSSSTDKASYSICSREPITKNLSLIANYKNNHKAIVTNLSTLLVK